MLRGGGESHSVLWLYGRQLNVSGEPLGCYVVAGHR